MLIDPTALSGPCVVLGAGGHARSVIDALDPADLLAVLDIDPDRIGRSLGGHIVARDEGREDVALHLAIGDNGVRRRIAERRAGARYRIVIHAQAGLARDAVIAEGAFVALGAAVQAGASVGRHVIVNTRAVIEHDCQIGDFAHVGPGAVLTGAVRVGEGALVGAGAVILPGRVIGNEAIIGAGAVVTRDVPAGARVAGCPARPL